MARRGNPSLRMAQRAQKAQQTKSKTIPKIKGLESFDDQLNKARQHLRQQQPEAALALLAPLQARSLTSAHQHRQIAKLLSQHQLYTEALTSLAQAKLHQCQDARVHEAVYRAKKALDHPLSEQLDAMQRAVRLCPTAPRLWNFLGSVAQAHQQSELACTAFKQSLQLDPSSLYSWYGLSSLINFADHPEGVEQLHQQLQQATSQQHAAEPSDASQAAESPTEQQQERVTALAVGWSSLGKAYQDLQQHQQAFKAYQQGKACLMAQQKPALSLSLGRYQDHQRAFNAAVYQRLHPETASAEPANTTTPQALYILGMPRSGKTLLENQLSLHAEIQPGREGTQLRDFIRGQRPERGRQLTQWLQQMTTEQRQTLADLWQQQQPQCASRYLTQTLPWNINYLGHLGLLDPKAPLIHITREPLDLGLSIYFKVFKASNSYSLDLAKTGEQIALYEAMCQHWQAVLPNPQLQISYEELVTHPQATLEKVYQFLHLTPATDHLKETNQDAARKSASPSDNTSADSLLLGAGQSVDWVTPLRSDFTNLHHAYRDHLQPLIEGYQTQRDHLHALQQSSLQPDASIQTKASPGVINLNTSVSTARTPPPQTFNIKL